LVPPHYDRSVFINCPFDEEYEPILQAIIFAVLRLGFEVRISFERSNGVQNRLAAIVDLIRQCRFSVHDLSRSQAKAKGDIYRLNMPFELGIDYGCREFDPLYAGKEFLVLEEKAYASKAAISDLAGCDFEVHKSDHQIAVKKIRNWLVQEGRAENVAPARIFADYDVFQQYYWESQRAAGASEDDIREYPIREVFDCMKQWFAEGRPALPASLQI
jgi:hypothetical protein